MLNRIFDMENPVWRFLSRVADLMILNLLLILCSIPIFTIGASLTGVYYVCLKIREHEEGYIAKNFFKAFRQNFKQSTIIWLIMLALGLVLGLEFYMYYPETSTLGKVIKGMILAGAVMWIMVFFVIWPMQARFYNTIKNTFMNAILVSFANAPRSFAMVGLLVGVLFICSLNQYTLSYGVLYWILVGFAVQILANVYLVYPIIKKLMPESEDEKSVTENRFSMDEDADFSALGYTPIPEDEYQKMHGREPKKAETGPQPQETEATPEPQSLPGQAKDNSAVDPAQNSLVE